MSAQTSVSPETPAAEQKPAVTPGNLTEKDVAVLQAIQADERAENASHDAIEERDHHDEQERHRKALAQIQARRMQLLVPYCKSIGIPENALGKCLVDATHVWKAPEPATKQ